MAENNSGQNNHKYVGPPKPDNRFISAIELSNENLSTASSYCKKLYNIFNKPAGHDDAPSHDHQQINGDNISDDFSSLGQLSNYSSLTTTVNKPASDSIDNNCFFKEGDSFESFKDILDRFEANTVERYRNEIFNIHDRQVNMIMGPLKSEIEVDYKDEKKKAMRTYNHSGYYSEYFGVNKPLYNSSLKCLVDITEREDKSDGHLYRAVRCETNDTENVTQKTRKDVSHLINYFESVKWEKEKLPPPKDIQSKIFEEVSYIRDKEVISVRDSLNRKNKVKKCVGSTLDEIIPPPPGFETIKFHSAPLQFSGE